MMAFVRHFIIIIVFVFSMHDVFATGTDGDISNVLNELLHRIESLEARDAAKDAKISALESEIFGLKLKINDIEKESKTNEANMQARVNLLEQKMAQSNEEAHEESMNDIGAETAIPRRSAFKRLSRNFRTNREIPENGIAFYATHTEHDIHHLGANQVLLFQQAITNIGNAYNNNTGAFVAPVDGIYVFHATVMGIDPTVQGHIEANFDVDGTRYSRLFVTSYDQSSQMLVIFLTTGQTVTVRNHMSDNGFIGQHYSTFSGFLLYSDYPSASILG